MSDHPRSQAWACHYQTSPSDPCDLVLRCRHDPSPDRDLNVFPRRPSAHEPAANYATTHFVLRVRRWREVEQSNFARDSPECRDRRRRRHFRRVRGRKDDSTSEQRTAPVRSIVGRLSDIESLRRAPTSGRQCPRQPAPTCLFITIFRTRLGSSLRIISVHGREHVGG